jgi:ribosomal protein L29
MKVTNERQELRGISKEALQERVNLLRKQLFTLRLNAATAHVKDYSQFSSLRKAIARGLTYLKQK